MKTIKTIAAAVALTASLGVVANQFTDMDYDNNGVVTMTEFNNYDMLVSMESDTLNKINRHNEEIERLQSIVNDKITSDNDERYAMEVAKHAEFTMVLEELNKLVDKMEQQSIDLEHISKEIKESEILFEHLTGIIDKI